VTSPRWFSRLENKRKLRKESPRTSWIDGDALASAFHARLNTKRSIQNTRAYSPCVQSEPSPGEEGSTRRGKGAGIADTHIDISRFDLCRVGCPYIYMYNLYILRYERTRGASAEADQGLTIVSVRSSNPARAIAVPERGREKERERERGRAEAEEKFAVAIAWFPRLRRCAKFRRAFRMTLVPRAERNGADLIRDRHSAFGVFSTVCAHKHSVHSSCSKSQARYIPDVQHSIIIDCSI